MNDTAAPKPAAAIPPTVGRKVWFRPNGAQTLNGATFENYASQPMDATIVCVWGERLVNLQVVDHGGISHGLRSVTLIQPGDPAPAGFYCEWMPFQVGQAKPQTA